MEDSAFSDCLLQLSDRVVAAARSLGLAVSMPHAAYLLLLLPPAAAAGTAAAAAAAAAAGDVCTDKIFWLSADAAATLSEKEADAAVAAAVLLLQQTGTDPVAAALSLQVAFEAALLDSAAAAALQQTTHSNKVHKAAALLVHAEHSRLRDPGFVCWLRKQLLIYCVAALPCVSAAADPSAAAAAAAAKAPAAAAAEAATAAATKAASVLRLVEAALDAAQPINRLPCLYALPKQQRMQHLQELSCIVMASLLLQQRQAAAAAAAAADEFAWLTPPEQLATELAAKEQQLLQQQAVHAQDALQRIRNIFSLSKQQRESIGVHSQLARVIAAESVFQVQQIRFLQALLVQQQQRRSAAAAAAATCEEELAAVEACLQQHHGRVHPDAVYGRLAAAGAAYLEVYRQHQVQQQLAELRLLLQQQAAALRAPDTTKLDVAALRIRRRMGSDQRHTAQILDSSSSSSSSSSSMRVLETAFGEGEPKAALEGYCLYALQEDGLLIPGDPQAGALLLLLLLLPLLLLLLLLLLLQKHILSFLLEPKPDAALVNLLAKPVAAAAASPSCAAAAVTAAAANATTAAANAAPVAAVTAAAAHTAAAAAAANAAAAAGGIEVNGEVYSFSSRSRLEDFLQQQQQRMQQHPQPELLLQQQLACTIRSNPALIFTLSLEERFPVPNLKSLLAWAYTQELWRLQQQQQQQQRAGEVGEECPLELCVRLSEGKAADAANDTSDLLQLTAQPRSSSSSSSSSSWDEWELRRQALQQARLCGCETRSMQTEMTAFFRDAETQQEETKETATNTDVAAATVGPRSIRRFRGLRGAAAKEDKPLETVVYRLKL
ncbi:hypothetical protein Emag_000681 [Eimeria magna]